MQAHPPFHLRPVRIGDALDLTELERALIQDGRGMVKTLEELPEDREAAEAGVWPWIEMLPWRGLRLVAEDATGQLVAELDNHREQGSERLVIRVPAGIRLDDDVFGYR